MGRCMPKLALRSGIEPPSPHRQCGRLIQMRNGAISVFVKLVRSAGIEPARLPTALSRRRVYLFRHERELFELEGLVGLEPTMTYVNGLRIRSLGRWGHRPLSRWRIRVVSNHWRTG